MGKNERPEKGRKKSEITTGVLPGNNRGQKISLIKGSSEGLDY